MTVGGDELPLDFEVPNGTRVEVVASAHDLARRAFGVFGWPLGALGAAAFLAEWVGTGEALIVAAFFGAALAVVAVRAAKIRDGFSVRGTRRSENPVEGLRVVPRG